MNKPFLFAASVAFASVLLAASGGCEPDKKAESAVTEKRWKSAAAHFDSGEIAKMQAAQAAAAQKAAAAAKK